MVSGAVALTVVVLVGILIGLAATAAGVALARVTGWRMAGGIVLIAMTPLVPRVDIGLGLGLDDILPVVGVAFLLVTVPLRAPRIRGYPGSTALWVAVAGVALYVAAGVISSLANAESLGEAVRMLFRSSGRMLFLGALAGLVAAAVHRYPAGDLLAARALALMGVAEATFGLFAFLVPLPDRIGLAGTRPWSVLFGEVPGRISGTLGLSPNFTGAVLMLSLVVTVGLAARPIGGRERTLWLIAATLQLVALTLTFSRAPLGAAIVGLVLLVLVVSRPVLLLPLAGIAAVMAFLTPIAGRFLSDVTDRLALWYSATLIMIDNPVTGVGPARMLEVMRSWPQRYMDTPVGRAVNNAHNTILLPAAELGVLGAIGAALLNVGLATLAVVAVLRVRRRRTEAHVVAGAIGLLAFLLQGMVNNLFTVGVTSVMGAFVLGAFVLPATLRGHDDW